ncbi:hypothetical protein HMPREF0043_00820 [Actinobaculum sp. oral taxon 183 str. F0552]|nr:hypothetical protein HMPREF0043_00820 [Actinobaculum sp. oral taxon 183 str. F0552]
MTSDRLKSLSFRIGMNSAYSRKKKRFYLVGWAFGNWARGLPNATRHSERTHRSSSPSRPKAVLRRGAGPRR